MSFWVDLNNCQFLNLEQINAIDRKTIKDNEITINLDDTKYGILTTVAERLNIKEIGNSKDKWNIKWQDTYISDDDLKKMQSNQKINHFPQSQLITKKNNLAKYLKLMYKHFPQEYDFFPKSWVLPQQMHELTQYMKKNNGEKKKKVLIVKPAASCQGKGIYLLNSLKELNPDSQMVAQQYIQNPLLIGKIFYLDGLKFDCRLYVLVKSLDPLKIYLYKEGIARFATSEFEYPNVNFQFQKSNINNIYMHLTNYAINKKNPIYQENHLINQQEHGHKRSFTSILSVIQQYQYLKEQKFQTDDLMESIRTLILKTILAVQPMMLDNFKLCRPKDANQEKCFEVLGFDVLIDQKLKPWLIEVNHSPSFAVESKLDRTIKYNLLLDTLILIQPQSFEVEQQSVEKKLPYNKKKTTKQLRRSIDLYQKDQKELHQKDQKYEKEQNEIQIQLKKNLFLHENKNLNGIFFIEGFTRVYPQYPYNTFDIQKYLDQANLNMEQIRLYKRPNLDTIINKDKEKENEQFQKTIQNTTQKFFNVKKTQLEKFQLKHNQTRLDFGVQSQIIQKENKVDFSQTVSQLMTKDFNTRNKEDIMKKSIEIREDLEKLKLTSQRFNESFKKFNFQEVLLQNGTNTSIIFQDGQPRKTFKENLQKQIQQVYENSMKNRLICANRKYRQKKQNQFICYKTDKNKDYQNFFLNYNISKDVINKRVLNI